MKPHGRVRSLSNGRLRMTFGATPLAIASLRNLLTERQFCINGTQSLIVRTPHAISEPMFLSELGPVSSTRNSVHIMLRDRSGKCRADLELLVTELGLAYRLQVHAQVPIWVVEWRLRGLELDEVILPALGGQSLNSRMPSETSLTYKYPFWWNAQFVLGKTKGGGVWIRSLDVEPVFKFIRVKRSGDKFDLSYGVEAHAPFRSKTLEATWYIDCYLGGWKNRASVHRDWLKKSFRLTPLGENRFFPAWAQNINFVLEIWGIGKDDPAPLHTFDQMIERLRQWSKIHDPARTLLYLPGFAEHGIDSRAPHYAPSPELGGRAGFKTLVDSAHSMGYRVMVHTNALCMTFMHPEYRHFRKHQVVDGFGRRQGWALDIDGDWIPEPYFAYINPGVRAWRELMKREIGMLVRRFSVDAVFLDQTLLAFNVSRGSDFLAGMRSLIGALQQAFPHILFAGEGLHEQVVSALPMAQIHGIDSLTEVHGLEGKVRWRNAHPVSTYLFGPFTRFTAHLLTRHPTHFMFRIQESSYKRLGVIPALCLYNNCQILDMPEVRAMIRRAETL